MTLKGGNPGNWAETHPSRSERFLVTGALGCIGAWVVYELVGQGVEVVAFDKGDDDFRIRSLLEDSAMAQVTQVQGDIVDPQVIRAVVHDHDVTNVVYLAALQMPPCSTDPRVGALVNVVGTINVFDAVRDTRASERPIVYSSSVAALDAPDETSTDASTLNGRPASHYGVFKVANEGSARVFARESGISSIGLRPHVVYGVGRDQGRTTAVTKAILAAALNEPFEITFTGFCRMQYAQDVAKAFIAASRTDTKGALVVNVEPERGCQRRRWRDPRCRPGGSRPHLVMHLHSRVACRRKTSCDCLVVLPQPLSRTASSRR